MIWIQFARSSFLLVWFWCAPIVAQETEPLTSGPQCGIYCMYAVARHEGMKPRFESLLKPEFVSTTSGSTADDLCRAAGSLGLNALPMSNLSASSLRAASCPFILHYKATARSRVCDHWVVFLGDAGGQAEIYNPPNSPQRMSYAELLGRWDGAGVAISKARIDSATLRRADIRQFLEVGGIVLFGLGVTVALSRRADARTTGQVAARSLRDAMVLLGLPSLVALSYHSVADDGLLVKSQNAQAVEAAFDTSFLRKMDGADVERAIRRHDGDVVLIDSRYPEDYAAGHIEGALNISVELGDAQVGAALANVPKDAALLIYCQSAGCPFAERVAQKLLSNGYHNIALFPGGWAEWEQLHTGKASSSARGGK